MRSRFVLSHNMVQQQHNKSKKNEKKINLNIFISGLAGKRINMSSTNTILLTCTIYHIFGSVNNLNIRFSNINVTQRKNKTCYFLHKKNDFFHGWLHLLLNTSTCHHFSVLRLLMINIYAFFSCFFHNNLFNREKSCLSIRRGKYRYKCNERKNEKIQRGSGHRIKYAGRLCIR